MKAQTVERIVLHAVPVMAHFVMLEVECYRPTVDRTTFRVVGVLSTAARVTVLDHFDARAKAQEALIELCRVANGR